jgi:hypothetical protein
VYENSSVPAAATAFDVATVKLTPGIIVEIYGDLAEPTSVPAEGFKAVNVIIEVACTAGWGTTVVVAAENVNVPNVVRPLNATTHAPSCRAMFCSCVTMSVALDEP